MSTRKGIRVVPRDSPDYPTRLASIFDPPPVLWARGSLGPCPHAVAVIGSRFATPHALEIGARLGHGLAAAGFAVVSGLARGVDAAAHRGALRGGGRTIAVLGCGIDVAYPPENKGLMEQIGRSGHGAVVAEQRDGQEAEPQDPGRGMLPQSSRYRIHSLDLTARHPRGHAKIFCRVLLSPGILW